MSGALVPAIEPDAVTDIEPLHGPAQVGFRRFDQLMKMIVHQHEGMNADTEALGGLGEQLQEMETVVTPMFLVCQ